MVSDYIEQHGGFLWLSTEEFRLARNGDPEFPETACAFLEYVEKRRVLDLEKFMANVKVAAPASIANFKYPTLLYGFSIIVAAIGRLLKIHLRAQPCMRNGQVQKLINEDGVPTKYLLP